ncbi:response regulator [Methylopila sp. Yamaguchi]|uniref:response regulator n=1 Tax=Methylopila sp. Yamaguchi TaxID=1437817 RepID=UPI000CC7E732|nr:response regulator [Methylopila sp. Yamaguchi]GBD47935.1 response regulator receiver protein [Methylopila sp. Yamaguchi]
MPASRGPVLVVDDDEAVRRSLRFALELEGLDVRLYVDGPALLGDEANLPATGCLVVDQFMPGMEGVELMTHLRLRQVRLPAIMITAKASDGLRARAHAAGFGLVLEKPLHDGALVAGIRGALAAP